MLTQTKSPKGFFTESDSSLQQKFSEAGFGFEENGKTFFHPLEAAYLAKIGKTKFEKFETAEKFAASQKKTGKIFPFAFSVYFQIRQTGRIIRPYLQHTNFLRAYAPGVGREKERPSQLVCLLPGEFPSAKSLAEQVKIAHLARLDLIIACGTESEIKFFKISSFNW